MSSRTTLHEQLEALTAPICRAHGVDLVDVRFVREQGGAVVRVLIERAAVEAGAPTGGVSLDDCTSVSRDLSSALDVHDVVPGRYRLEVSSPGVERPLIRKADYERFAGREVRVQTVGPVEGRRRFQGRLIDVVGDAVRVEQDGKPVTLPLDNVAKANLVFRFESSKRPHAR